MQIKAKAKQAEDVLSVEAGKETALIELTVHPPGRNLPGFFLEEN